jgi:hypothetical protein
MLSRERKEDPRKRRPGALNIYVLLEIVEEFKRSTHRERERDVVLPTGNLVP